MLKKERSKTVYIIDLEFEIETPYLWFKQHSRGEIVLCCFIRYADIELLDPLTSIILKNYTLLLICPPVLLVLLQLT